MAPAAASTEGSTCLATRGSPEGGAELGGDPEEDEERAALSGERGNPGREANVRVDPEGAPPATPGGGYSGGEAISRGRGRTRRPTGTREESVDQSPSTTILFFTPL